MHSIPLSAHRIFFLPAEPLEARIAPAAIGVAALNGTTGFAISGIAANDMFGSSTAILGDINGDGYDDVLIGAPGVDRPGVTNEGEAYVIFGAAGPVPLSISAAMLDGTNGFRTHARPPKARPRLAQLSRAQVI